MVVQPWLGALFPPGTLSSEDKAGLLQRDRDAKAVKDAPGVSPPLDATVQASSGAKSQVDRGQTEVDHGQAEVGAGEHVLQLEHVYGFRGRDCRGNVHLLRNGEVSYHVASIGIIANVRDGTQHLYSGHKSRPVTCMGLHPDGLTLVTGAGADSGLNLGPLICVWSLREGSTSSLAQILDGEVIDSVSCICFSKDGSHVVAVGGTWPCLVLAVYDWAVVPAVLVAHARLGGDQTLCVACNPLSDQIITCGVRSLSCWQASAACKELLRFKLGVLRWKLRERLLSRAMEESKIESAGQDDRSSEQRSRRKGDAEARSEPSLQGRDLDALRTVKSYYSSASKLYQAQRPVAAISEARAGVFWCEQLLLLLDRLAVEQGAGFDSNIQTLFDGDCVTVRKVLNSTIATFQEMLAKCESMRSHKTRFLRSYDIDDENRALFRAIRDECKSLTQADKELLLVRPIPPPKPLNPKP